MSRGFTFKVILAGLVLAFMSVPVTLGQQDEARAENLFHLSLEELLGITIVSARKRLENIQEIPVSVTSYSDNELAARQIDNITQIAASTPNLVFDSTTPISGSNSASSVFIRGVGQTDFTFVTDPGVGLYLDGVYVARAVGGVINLIDVERVEVLRGPQGTLFGKNTIGGAVNISSKRPKDTLGGAAEITIGSDDRIDLITSVNIPATQTLSLRLSYANLNQDGYVKNHGGGPNLSDTDAQIARLVAAYEPSTHFSAIVSLEASRRREQARAQKLVRFNPDAPPTFGAFPALEQGSYDQRFLAGGPFATFQGEKPFVKSDLDLYGASLELNYQLTALQLKSITAYRNFDAEFGRDSDNSEFSIIQTEDHMDHRQFSQEFHLGNMDEQDTLTWLLGLFYFEESGDNLNVVSIPLFDVVSGGGIDNSSWALFGQASYALNDKLSLTAGARYTDESKEFLPDQYVRFNQYTLPVYGGAGFEDGQRILPLEKSSRDFDNFSALLSLDYQWSDRLMGYLSYSEGYKSGGFNQRVFPPRSEPGSFDPEQVSVYELGWKLRNEANTVRLNGAVFYTDYTDVQVKVIDVVAPGTGNAAGGRIYGGELELAALVGQNLSLKFTAAYLDTKYTSFADDFDPSQGIDKRSHFVNSPKWSLSSSASYIVHLNDTGDLTLRADWSYRSKVYNDAGNSEFIAQGDLHLLNAGMVLDSRSGKWQFGLQARNITDQSYVETGNDEFNGFGYTELIYARPREWSLSVKRIF